MTADVEASSLRKDRLRDFSASPRLLLLSAMAIVAGTAGAAAAWVLLKLIALFTNLAYFQRLSVSPAHFEGMRLSAWSIAIPVVGGVIVGLIARYGSDKIRGHGIPEAIEAILIGQSRIDAKVAILKPLSSAIAIGTGGPFGAEGPIIMTGGAIGSLFAQFFRLSAPERKTLLVAGSAAGMTAVFGTPLAAVLLSVELLLFEWKPRSFVPVVVGCVVAMLWRPWLIGSGALFPYAGNPAMPWWGLGLCALVGVVAGLQSALMTVCLYAVEDLFRKLPIHWMWWPAIGSVAVGLGGYLDPAALGVGYENIRLLLSGGMNMQSALALLCDKAAIWIVALSSGTSGGVLAPLLMMGGALGSIESHYLPFGDEGFWVLIGMAAILGGTMRAPLTSTIFAVELTGDTHVLLPLLAASVAAFGLTVLVMRRSILTERIARRGHHISREYTIDPFLQMRVEQIMAKPVHTLAASIPADEAIAFFMTAEGRTRHKSYPVVNEAGKLIGMVSRADVLNWMRGPVNPGATLGDLTARDDIVFAYADDLTGKLADTMAITGVARVPILDRDTERVVGLVALRDLIRVRALRIREERERRRLLRVGIGREATS
ncbi:MAG TPA: chloride channel protein [Rhizomicrobium sp.]|nr:chloride channel protein [Rhizomicrobium sp.]